jgi:hypothetical protein
MGWSGNCCPMFLAVRRKFSAPPWRIRVDFAGKSVHTSHSAAELKALRAKVAQSALAMGGGRPRTRCDECRASKRLCTHLATIDPLITPPEQRASKAPERFEDDGRYKTELRDQRISAHAAMRKPDTPTPFSSPSTTPFSSPPAKRSSSTSTGPLDSWLRESKIAAEIKRIVRALAELHVPPEVAQLSTSGAASATSLRRKLHPGVSDC